MINYPVFNGTVQVSAKFALNFDGFTVLPKGDKYLLNNILGYGFIANPFKGCIEHRFPMSMVDLFHGLVIIFFQR
ncbi:hypothetical protein D3C73_1425920 [compost metagenome]